MKYRTLSLLAAASICGLVALQSASGQSGKKGYLEPGSFDILAVLPAAPVKGDARYEADRKIFKQTRKMIGTPRWDLATSDVPTSQADLMADFSCALGVKITPLNAPITEAFVARARADTGRGTYAAKEHYKRVRPFEIDKGKICEPEKELKGSWDYPSGHTTLGWTWAMLLAQIAPDRATQILARGRAYGESRIVCGAHNASAVDAGRLSATSTIIAMSSLSEFRSDLAAATKEIADLRTKGEAVDAVTCDRESALIAQSIFATTGKK